MYKVPISQLGLRNSLVWTKNGCPLEDTNIANHFFTKYIQKLKQTGKIYIHRFLSRNEVNYQLDFKLKHLLGVLGVMKNSVIIVKFTWIYYKKKEFHYISSNLL